jgi:Ca-activated chloride channel family protein
MSLLEGFHQSSRWVLLLLLLVPFACWWAYGWRRTPAMRFSSTAPLSLLRQTWRVRWRWVIPAIRATALVLLIVALARPRKGNEQTRIPAEGIAIQLLVDRSGSMQAMDFVVDGRRSDRLEAVKHVVEDFVMGEDDLRGRPDDLIGMITFARYADSKCPLTLDHGFLIESSNDTEIATKREEDGTAIGDAIGLGVERLRALEEQRKRRGLGRIKSRVMVLLTDGENNAGVLGPLQAAEMAAAFDIKVYTIGAGTRGLAPMPVIDPFTRRTVLRNARVSIDEETLRKIAEATGGEYFRATDTDSLRNIYAEIDQLEKTRTEELRFYQYKELATQSIELGPVPVPPLLLCVFVLLALELLLTNTVFRRVP